MLVCLLSFDSFIILLRLYIQYKLVKFRSSERSWMKFSEEKSQWLCYCQQVCFYTYLASWHVLLLQIVVMSMSICVSVLKHISRTMQFLCNACYQRLWLSPPLAALWCVSYVWKAHCQRIKVEPEGGMDLTQWLILRLTHQGQHWTWGGVWYPLVLCFACCLMSYC